MESEYSDVTPIDAKNKTYKFTCEKCMYKCDNKFSYNKHLSTPKHLKLESDVENIQEHTCNNCNNSYKHKSGLSRHKRTCTVVLVSSPKNELVNVVTDYLKNAENIQRQHLELNKQLLELYRIMILSRNPDANIN